MPFILKYLNLFSILLISAGVVGCSDDEAGTPGADRGCEGFATSFDDYSAGIQKNGSEGVLSLRLVDALPSPPNRGDNTWTVQAIDSSGTPVNDASITDVTPFMPDHGHGTATLPQHEWAGQDGMCEVSAIDFMMPGVWEVRFDLMTADSQTDRVVFAFCIEG